MVADHDLEYIDFEGIIPTGRLGAGPVVVWDSGAFTLDKAEDPENGLRSGKLTFVLNGGKLKGIFTLARLRKGETGKEWLLIKGKDSQGDPSWVLKSELTPDKLRELLVKVPPCESS
jgi:bifunctional non-homologous end joining protein LigD